ncbi:MAG: nuclear transport factor 2 family protein [Alphaproteobacteria bacterium]|nr:nuclear transport factor 2 family protein [Alphaproteobacteria bacterium]
MKDALIALEEQMQLYFDGLYHSDTARLRKVFHPDARYVCATGEETVNLGMDEYLPVVEKREPPAARGEARRDAIVSITLAGPKTALVHAHCAIADRYFSDFLSFIKTPDGWRIIAKVFHYDLMSPGGR